MGWNKELNAYVTIDVQLTGEANPNLVYDRTPQRDGIPNETTPAHWLAWESDAKGNPITDVSKLKQVVWKNIGTDEKPAMEWVKMGSSFWATGNNVWDSSTRSWENYQ